MGVRLNKVLTELNIGLQTAVDFLKKKSSLGEIRDDATTNTKITDEQYEALVREFSGDKAVKTQAEKLFTKMKEKKDKKPAEKHAAPAQEKSDDAAPARQQFKPLGKIDLDSLNKPKAKAAEPVVETKPEPEAPAEPEAPVVKEEKKVEAVKPAEPEVAEPVKPAEPEPVKEEPVKAPVEEVSNDAPEAKEAEAPKAKETPAETEPANDGPEIFTLKSEAKLAPKVNVLGKIDLSTLNQSTRPKKKTKEEKRKQREEKAAQMHGGANNGQPGEKRKRERIRGGKVDIEEAAKQQQQGQNQNNNKKNKNKGGNQNFQDNNNNQQQGGKNKKNKNRQPVRPIEANEEDVARQVKETLARLTSKTSQNKKGAKYRKEKRDAVQERMSEEMAAEAAQSKVLKLTEFVTVSELATMMDVPVVKVIGTCMSVGIMVSINQRLNAETINLVAEEFGFTTEYVSAEVQEAITEEVDDENDLISRAPIVTVMGHVDHGKTSLLDHIRNTNVIAGEAGGITQHIGAYNVTLKNGQSITFLDTPGHEAFTAMRARGAQVTDIAIIIVAADDSVMPTTKEAIAHAQAANVPMVFAINKIDKPGANPDKIREDLANMNLLVEDWGGKYQCQEISAKKGVGVYELLEKVLL